MGPIQGIDDDCNFGECYLASFAASNNFFPQATDEMVSTYMGMVCMILCAPLYSVRGYCERVCDLCVCARTRFVNLSGKGAGTARGAPRSEVFTAEG